MIEVLDIGELQLGYAIGKAVRIADWAARKETREFQRLVAQLRSRKWWRDVKAEGGERLANLRARHNARNKRPDVRAQLNEAQNRRRRVEHERAAAVLTCEECGKTWPKPYRKGMHARFCSAACRARMYWRTHPSCAERQRERRRRAREASE